MLVLASGLSSYLFQVSQIERLSDEEERKLTVEFAETQDPSIAYRLVTSNLGLVVYIAKKYQRYGLGLADLISEGNIGLMTAVKKFDPAKGCKLVTYATIHIRTAINNYILRTWSLVNMGTNLFRRKIFYNLRKCRRQLNAIDEKVPLTQEQATSIANTLKVPTQDVIDMDIRMSNSDLYLDKVNENGNDIDIPDAGLDQEKELIVAQQSKLRSKYLQDAIQTLDDREQFIIRNRRLNDDPMTLDEIGEIFKISSQRVSQIEIRALQKLKVFLENTGFAFDND